MGRIADLLRRVLIGRRIASEQELTERIGAFKGLAVFASDNISSSAYASEEIASRVRNHVAAPTS